MNKTINAYIDCHYTARASVNNAVCTQRLQNDHAHDRKQMPQRIVRRSMKVLSDYCINHSHY